MCGQHQIMPQIDDAVELASLWTLNVNAGSYAGDELHTRYYLLPAGRGIARTWCY